MSSVIVVREAINQYFRDLTSRVERRSSTPNYGRDLPADGKQLFDMYRLLAVCHTAVVEKDSITGEISYSASSPDELALIKGAKQIGLTLLEKDTSKMMIDNMFTGQVDEYEILAEFPFDSTRKRMSLIVRFGGKYMIMCKGADSILIPRCSFKSESEQE